MTPVAAVGTATAVRRARLAGGPRALLHALGALEADRGRAHAVRADRPVAALAADVGLPVGVPVAGRRGRSARTSVGSSLIGVRRVLGQPVSAPRRSTDSMTTGSRRPVHRPGRRGGDRVDDRARVRVLDLAEDRVLAVQVRRRADRDEELRAVGARPGVGHREQVRAVELQLGVELVLERGSPGRRGRRRAGQPPWIMNPSMTRWKVSPS